ncbi:uncharacterized protein EAE98_000114 [Botrytis deweyae]|uniref:Heterokaryon incompatibility domain-containing protein n=1 Tax=Botrytis deweyae TaxID=2478750 RepID=A0ABQ7J1S3_9HELO|nr:uncharacterized protein EAE98_000114 [Botrytis deweyae]KAF7939987.1 hypothetical protein EAE98_000114 [Botrytis deweyae]
MDDSTSADSQMTAIQHMQSWLSACDEQHTCNALTSDRPSWLVDTVEYCIVPGSNPNNYVALSYTWQDSASSENEEPFRLLEDNLKILTQPGALRNASQSLPKVILDAMELTTRLGQRYLWVDRLCIIQDQEIATISEVMRMDQVYAGAYVTIVAAAKFGLFDKLTATLSDPGFKNKRKFNGQSWEIRAHYSSVADSKWAERAWTYQEAILSNRVIFFCNRTAFWQCECATWDMGFLSPGKVLDESTSTMSEFSLMRSFSVPSYPDFGLYMDLICPYNGRKLTDDKDGLSACLGILNRLAPSFPGGFMHGLPALFLDYALLWQPLKDCYRRTSTSKNARYLPSWAWCGWECFVDPWSFQASFCLDSNDSLRKDKAGSWKLQNLVTWEASSSVSGSDWLKETTDQLSTNIPQLSIPDVQRKEKNITDPDRKLTTHSSIYNDIESTFLSCLTEHAFFLPSATLRIEDNQPPLKRGIMHVFTEPILNEKPLSSLPSVIVLQNQKGVFCGLLRITGDAEYERGTPMELVAISEGSASLKDMAMCFEEKVFQNSQYCHPGPFNAEYDSEGWWTGVSGGSSIWGKENYEVIIEGEYEENLILPDGCLCKDCLCEAHLEGNAIREFYNVLWVRRENGIAHRVGCGRIIKDRWRQNDPEKTRIILN